MNLLYINTGSSTEKTELKSYVKVFTGIFFYY